MACNNTLFHFQSEIKFCHVEDEPLMNKKQSETIVTLSLTFLFIGIVINSRIFMLLSRRKNGIIIDKLFISNTILSGLVHSIVLANYVGSHLFYPMSDYIGNIGCLTIVHFLDVFIRFYDFCFPVAIASIRYIFVVQNLWVRTQGMKRIVNAVIFFSISVPILMALTVQYPVSDQIHFAYNR